LPALPSLPTLCALCRAWSPDRVCASCRERHMMRGPRCMRCALRVPEAGTTCGACLVDPPPFDTTLTALDYGHPWDHLVARFKFHAALDLAAPLAALLAAAWRDSGAPRPDCIVPVPLSAARLAERGYNQAWQLARPLARRLGCAADARLLLRIKDTRHQLAIPVAQRAANVRSAFAVEPARRSELRGRHVAVVDDVMTTGSTAAEIARVLRQAGAAAVHVWVVARTPAPSD
jgi:ComF family protein